MPLQSLHHLLPVLLLCFPAWEVPLSQEGLTRLMLPLSRLSHALCMLLTLLLITPNLPPNLPRISVPLSVSVPSMPLSGVGGLALVKSGFA